MRRVLAWEGVEGCVGNHAKTVRSPGVGTLTGGAAGADVDGRAAPACGDRTGTPVADAGVVVGTAAAVTGTEGGVCNCTGCVGDDSGAAACTGAAGRLGVRAGSLARTVCAGFNPPRAASPALAANWCCSDPPEDGPPRPCARSDAAWVSVCGKAPRVSPAKLMAIRYRTCGRVPRMGEQHR